MNKNQRKKLRKNSFLEGELRRYVHRSTYLEGELEKTKKEVKLYQGIIDASEAYLIYAMQKCGVSNVDLDIEAAASVLDKVRDGEICVVIDTEKRCIKIAEKSETEA